MVQLLLARWCEPPAPRQLHLSTLVQQVLSVIAQHGGVLAKDLYLVLCKSGPFRNVDSELFEQLLRCLGEQHILTQTSDGALTLGNRGETLVEHYSFYAAFATPDEYRLVVGSKTLGTLPITQPLAPGSHLIFAGRRWEVRRIDETARVIELTHARGGRAPRFEGVGFDVHNRVRAEMHRIYASSTVPVYLDATAKELLTEGRHLRALGTFPEPSGRKRELCPPVPLVWGSRASHSGPAIECPEALRLGRRDRDRCSRHSAEAGRGGVGSSRSRRGGRRVHARRAGRESY